MISKKKIEYFAVQEKYMKGMLHIPEEKLGQVTVNVQLAFFNIFYPHVFLFIYFYPPSFSIAHFLVHLFVRVWRWVGAGTCWARVCNRRHTHVAANTEYRPFTGKPCVGNVAMVCNVTLQLLVSFYLINSQL